MVYKLFLKFKMASNPFSGAHQRDIDRKKKRTNSPPKITKITATVSSPTKISSSRKVTSGGQTAIRGRGGGGGGSGGSTRTTTTVDLSDEGKPERITKTVTEPTGRQTTTVSEIARQQAGLTPEDRYVAGVNDPITTRVYGEPVSVSRGEAFKQSRRDENKPTTAYSPRERFVRAREIQGTASVRNRTPSGEYRAADTNKNLAETLAIKADKLEFQAQRQTGEQYAIKQTQAFGVATGAEVVKIISNPFKYAYGVGQFAFQVATKPRQTLSGVASEAIRRPATTAGSLTGQALVLKGFSKVNPVKVEIVKDLNLPKSQKAARQILTETGDVVGSSGKKVYVVSEAKIEKGLTTGIKITYPSITSKRSGFRFTPEGSAGGKPSRFVASPTYKKVLDENPLYKELLETSIEVKPEPIVTYKTEIVKEGGRTIIRDRKIVEEGVGGREIEVSSGGSSPVVEPAPSGGVGGGGLNEITGYTFKNLGTKLGPKQRTKSVLVEESVSVVEPVVIKPFVRTSSTVLNVRSPVLVSAPTSSVGVVTRTFDRSGLVQTSGVSSRQSVVGRQQQSSIQSQTQLQKQVQSQVQVQKQVQSQVQVQKQIQKQVQVQVQVQKQVQASKLVQAAPRVAIPKTPLLIDLDYDKDVRLGSFGVEVRRRGSFKEIASGLTLKQAIQTGKERVSATAAATFRITRAKQPVEIGEGAGSRFYRKGSLFIERPAFRIESPGELQEITFEGIRTQRNKKTTRRSRL